MLKAIECVTITAPDVGAVAEAYTAAFGYRVVERGRLDARVAQSWDAPAAAGRECVLLQPASGAACFLRAVESPPTPGWAPMRTKGWNVNELLVQDPHALAARLAGTKFRMLGAPRPLVSNPEIVALEVLGPAGELTYLTCIPATGGSIGIRTPAASFVDRTFVAVVGGPDLEAMRTFWRDAMGLDVTETFPVQIPVLNEALGLGAEAVTPLALGMISDGFAVEFDQYPAGTPARPQRAGDLPPGMAVVTFTVAALPTTLGGLSAPQVHSGAPYHGRRAAVVRGPTGELIELVEAA